jgi:hypothetical protein
MNAEYFESLKNKKMADSEKLLKFPSKSSKSIWNSFIKLFIFNPPYSWSFGNLKIFEAIPNDVLSNSN